MSENWYRKWGWRWIRNFNATTENMQDTPISEENIASEKENLKKQFIEAIDSITTKEQVEVFQNILKSLGPTMRAVSSKSEHLFSTASNPNSSNTNIPHNKNIEHQRIFSTKTKRRKVDSAIVKPTPEESQNIALSLLLNNSEE